MPSLKIGARLEHATDGIAAGSVAATITTSGLHKQLEEITVGTSEESIAIAGDITGGQGPGYCQLKNQDGTNYVQVGTATGAYSLRLKAGQEACFPLDAAVTAIFAKANTAPCRLRVFIVEA